MLENLELEAAPLFEPAHELSDVMLPDEIRRIRLLTGECTGRRNTAFGRGRRFGALAEHFEARSSQPPPVASERVEQPPDATVLRSVDDPRARGRAVRPREPDERGFGRLVALDERERNGVELVLSLVEENFDDDELQIVRFTERDGVEQPRAVDAFDSCYETSAGPART